LSSSGIDRHWVDEDEQRALQARVKALGRLAADSVPAWWNGENDLGDELPAIGTV
jgi:hypothetical protein